MEFNAIPSGASVFLDVNILFYSFAADPTFGPLANALLSRIEQHDLEGYASAHDCSEAAHRLMTLEACKTFGWPYAGISRQRRRHTAKVQQLHEFREALDDIDAIGIHVLPVHAYDVLRAGDLSLQYGLLSGDALLVAIMQAKGLTQLASNDADFDRVPGITRFAPV
jgi:predicted nucleic acid-binding protein